MGQVLALKWAQEWVPVTELWLVQKRAPELELVQRSEQELVLGWAQQLAPKWVMEPELVPARAQRLVLEMAPVQSLALKLEQ